jgi:hypothetical protein
MEDMKRPKTPPRPKPMTPDMASLPGHDSIEACIGEDGVSYATVRMVLVEALLTYLMIICCFMASSSIFAPPPIAPIPGMPPGKAMLFMCSEC